LLQPLQPQQQLLPHSEQPRPQPHSELPPSLHLLPAQTSAAAAAALAMPALAFSALAHSVPPGPGSTALASASAAPAARVCLDPAVRSVGEALALIAESALRPPESQGESAPPRIGARAKGLRSLEQGRDAALCDARGIVSHSVASCAATPAFARRRLARGEWCGGCRALKPRVAVARLFSKSAPAVVISINFVI
jgi:hypothetical protein